MGRPALDPFHRYPPALRIRCPYCGARPGVVCLSRRWRVIPDGHPERVALVTGRPTRAERGAR